jgi:hypothetical protein
MFSRASVVYAITCLLLGVGGAIYLANNKGLDQVSIPVPAKRLEAYTPIQAGDLTTLRISKRHAAKNVVQEQSQLIGHYGLSVLQPGTAIQNSELGPKLPAAIFDETFITSVPTEVAAKLNGRLEPGAQVDLLVKGGDPPKPITGAYVLNVAADRSSAVLAIALERRDDLALGFPQGFLIGTSLGVLPPPKKQVPVRRRHDAALPRNH